MSRTYLLTLAAALVAAPLAYAHIDGMPYGTPKLYCEDSPLAFDQLTHDYGAPASGFIISLAADGSIPGGSLLPGGCTYGIFPDNWDAHYEWAIGGAFLLACEASCGDGTGSGSLVCWGTYADHTEFPTVWGFDHALGTNVQYTVAADHVQIPPPAPGEPACGDFETEPFGFTSCVSHCQVAFPAGLDGTYQVYVNGGTLGHIWTN